MNWTNEDNIALGEFIDAVDSDDIKIKEQIKKVLLNNRFIVHALNNKELEQDEDTTPDDYFNVNIFPYYLMPDAQSTVENYICYEVTCDELERNNKSLKIINIVFYILCKHHNVITDNSVERMVDGKDMVVMDGFGVARHDLIAALIQDQFNFNQNITGGKIKLISDKPGATDKAYISRTLVFEQVADNNLIKTRNGSARFENKISSPSQFEGGVD